MTSSEKTSSRQPLSKDRVLQAAVNLADRDGLDALTMRRLGAELGVEAMSLYKHVANKEEILDGILELVVGEIEIPEEGSGWKEAMRARARSARNVLGRHSWAVGLMEGRQSTGPAVMQYVNAILGNLRAGGFPIESAGYAFTMLDSYVYGHVIQETSTPVGTAEEMTEPLLEEIAGDDYPHLVEIAEEHVQGPGFTFDDAFEFGLDLILDGLERQADL